MHNVLTNRIPVYSVIFLTNKKIDVKGNVAYESDFLVKQ